MSLSGIAAVDDVLGAVDLGSSSLTPGAWTSGTLTYTVAEGELPGPLANCVVVSGTTAAGAVVTATDSALVYLSSNPAIAVAKVADPTTANVGQSITYTYHLTNTGDVSLSGIVAVDDVLGGADLGSDSLAPEAWTSRTLTYTVVEGDLPGPLANTVVVSGTPSVGSVVTAKDGAAVSIIVSEYRVWLPVVLKAVQP